jgi:hypothetical protein
MPATRDSTRVTSAETGRETRGPTAATCQPRRDPTRWVGLADGSFSCSMATVLLAAIVVRSLYLPVGNRWTSRLANDRWPAYVI